MDDLAKDFTVVVGRRKLRTNRGCLEKHSDYFKAMFSSGMRESLTSSVKLQNVDEDLMCQIIEFCERGVRIRVSEGNALGILAAGMMLQMEALKSTAEQFLIQGLSVENAADMFKAADFYGSASLRSACGKFICWSLEQLVDRLTPENLELVHYILRREYSHWNEDLMFRAVMAVIRGRSVEKAQELLDCLYARNITLNNDVFNMYRNAGLGLEGYRRDGRTLAIVLDQEVFYLDRRSSKFLRFTGLPVPCVGYGLVSHRQHLYFIGGEERIGQGKWNNSVKRYDFLKNSWEHFVDMPSFRRSFTCFATDTRIYVIGGYGKFRKSLEGELAVLDLETRTWFYGELRASQIHQEMNSRPNLLYSDKYFYLFDNVIQKLREEQLGKVSGELLVIANFPRETIKCSLQFGHDIIVITNQNNVYFCKMTTRTAKKLEPGNTATSKPDFLHCHIVDRTLFNVKVHKITEYLIDVEAFTLSKIKTYRMIDETSYENVGASCIIPYF